MTFSTVGVGCRVVRLRGGPLVRRRPSWRTQLGPSGGSRASRSFAPDARTKNRAARDHHRLQLVGEIARTLCDAALPTFPALSPAALVCPCQLVARLHVALLRLTLVHKLLFSLDKSRDK